MPMSISLFTAALAIYSLAPTAFAAQEPAPLEPAKEPIPTPSALLSDPLPLKFSGKLENDWSFYSADKSVEQVTDQFDSGTEFRRARFGMSGGYGDWLKFKASYDLQGDGSGFSDLYSEFDGMPGNSKLKFGHFKEPFSLETLTSSTSLTFMERSMLKGFAPSRNVGVQVRDTAFKKKMTWAAGLFRETDAGAFGVDESGQLEFALTGRVTWLPIWENDGETLLHLGLAASFRNPDEAEVSYSARPESHLAPSLLDTGDFLADDVILIGTEAAWVYGPATIQGEYAQAMVRRPNGENDVSFQAGYLMAAWMWTGETREYRPSRGYFGGITPSQPFAGNGGGSGAWETALRYSFADYSDDNIGGGEGQILMAAVNWHLTEHLRISMDYGIADLVTHGNAHILQFRFHLDW
ncbi:MAG: hypothetical protein HQ519_17960 [Planctomycetes bacterium]|nr:hypothetical protein [Planctomycetota bacterium]